MRDLKRQRLYLVLIAIFATVCLLTIWPQTAGAVASHEEGVLIQGALQIQDGTEGVSAECWVSTDTNGNANWDTCPGGGDTFIDDVFRVQGSGDATKEMAFEVDGITTGTTRTITMPDTDVDLADIGTNTTDISNKADRDLNNLTGPTNINQTLLSVSQSQNLGEDNSGTWGNIFGGSLIGRPASPGGIALNVQTGNVSKGRIVTEPTTPVTAIVTEVGFQCVGNTCGLTIFTPDNASGAASNDNIYYETGDHNAAGPGSFDGGSHLWQTGSLGSATNDGDSGGYKFDVGTVAGAGLVGVFDVNVHELQWLSGVAKFDTDNTNAFWGADIYGLIIDGQSAPIQNQQVFQIGPPDNSLTNPAFFQIILGAETFTGAATSGQAGGVELYGTILTNASASINAGFVGMFGGANAGTGSGGAATTAGGNATNGGSGGLVNSAGGNASGAGSTGAGGSNLISGGNSVDGPAGSIIATAGTASGSGADGVFRFINPDIGISGECWVSTDTAGTATWDTCPGISGSGTDSHLVRWDGANIQDSVIRVADTTGQLRNETPGQDFELRTIDNGAGDSGDLIFRAGTASGTRGSITFNALAVNYNFATLHTSNAQITWDFSGGAQPGTTDVFNLGDSANTFNDLSIGEVHVYRPGTGSRSGTLSAGTLSISGVGSGAGVFLFNPSIDNQRDVIIGTENQSSANNVGDIKVLCGGQTSTGDGCTILLKIGDNTDATGQLSTIELDAQIVNIKGDGFGFGRQGVNLTADNTNITPTEPYIGLTSDSGTATDRTFTLEQCNSVGRQLIIHWESANAGELLDDSAQGTAGNHRLAGDFTPTLDDTLMLLCDGTDWVEVSRSIN